MVPRRTRRFFARRYRVKQKPEIFVWPDPVQIDRLWGYPFPGYTGSFILGTAELDATQIHPKTVLFGASGSAPVWSFRRDIDRDGATDLGLVLRTKATGVQCGDREAPISGGMLDGGGFEQMIPIEYRCTQP